MAAGLRVLKITEESVLVERTDTGSRRTIPFAGWWQWDVAPTVTGTTKEEALSLETAIRQKIEEFETDLHDYEKDREASDRALALAVTIERLLARYDRHVAPERRSVATWQWHNRLDGRRGDFLKGADPGTLQRMRAEADLQDAAKHLAAQDRAATRDDLDDAIDAIERLDENERTRERGLALLKLVREAEALLEKR
jgi:hypothetical protein